MVRADPTGDVASSGGDSGDGAERPDPDQVHADIVSTRFLHTDIELRVNVTFVDLQRPSDTAPGGARGFDASVAVRTNERLARDVIVTAVAGYGTRVRMDDPSNEGLPCEVKYKIDYPADTISIAIPRTCLSNPAWVRVGAGASADLNDRAETLCIDKALTTGYRFTPGAPEALTSRLYAG